MITGMKRALWTAVMIGVVAFLAAPQSASAQAGGIGGRVATPDPANPRSQSIFLYTLKNGATKKDQLRVVNQTGQTKTIMLGSVDGVVTSTGSYTCRQAAEPVKDSGAWVTLAQKKVTVPAGGEKLVDFTVTVPKQADVGEHNSCLTLQAEEAPSEAQSGVRLRMRQAIRMVVTVPGVLNRQLSIEQFDVTNGGGEQKYIFAAANKGNVSADVDMQIRLTSLFGQEAMTTGGEYPVIPNETLRQEFVTRYRPLFGGWYYVTPSIRYDTRLGVFGTQQAAQYETKTGDRVLLFFWPTMTGWLLLIGGIVIVVGVLWLLLGKRKKRRALQQSARIYTVHEGDTLQNLARRLQVGWKDIARLNKLRPPYTIEVGQTLRLPTKNIQDKLQSSRKPSPDSEE